MKNSQIVVKTNEKHAPVPHMPSRAVSVVSMHATLHRGSRVGRQSVETSSPNEHGNHYKFSNRDTWHSLIGGSSLVNS